MLRAPDIKRSLYLAAWGQFGGVIAGFVAAIALSLLSRKNFFDSPIRIALFTTACGIIGGTSVFSAELSLSATNKLGCVLALALAIDVGLCGVFKLLLSRAGNDSPVGRVFTLVSCALALSLSALGARAQKKRHIEESNQGGIKQQVAPPRYALLLRKAVARGAFCALAMFFVLLAVWLGGPLWPVVRIDGWGIVLYTIIGFFLPAVASLGRSLECGAQKAKIDT